ncbi:MAG TPA: endonuclease Q family protein, partial [archaeon]|nr:endonuclease Q family protein [archaeon]
HIHSKYSRATSQNMTLEEIARNAKIKGLDILGTGDFTHPLWLKEIKKKLAEEDGIYDYDGVKFIPSGEISLIYNQGEKTRKIHYLLLAENFSVVDQINEFLDKKGRRDYDGRPIFGFSSIELAEQLMSISNDIEIIPAHAWTPWFAIFGSMSGFDSVEECFQEKAKYIHSIETGMSSDPALNWRISGLDKYTLISNSDAHSATPLRLGREANVFELKKTNYKNIINAIRTGKNFLFTIEVNPAYGKYHFDGHRNCNVCLSPKESKNKNSICPVCKNKLTIGVLHRIEGLADRPENYVPKEHVPFKSLLPLEEIISFIYGYSKKVKEIYSKLIDEFNNEFNILLNAEKGGIKKITGEKIADMVIRNREGKIKVSPGYDGEYGKIIDETDKISEKRQRTLSDF